MRYQEIAVLLRSPRAYDVALASAFERAGIDAFFVEGVPRIDPAARGLSLLLDLVGKDLDRGRVMEFVTSARINWDERPRPRGRGEPFRLGSPVGEGRRRLGPRGLAALSRAGRARTARRASTRTTATCDATTACSD